MRWEHKTVQVSGSLSSSKNTELAGPVEMALNREAEDGWELVQLIPQFDAGYLAVFKRAVALLALLVGAFGASCSTPSPKPPAPTPAPTINDAFTGAVVDCDKAESPAPVDDVRACLDLDTASACLVGMLAQFNQNTIACTVRDLSMQSHVQIAKGAATDQVVGEAKSADQWTRDHQIGYR